jgi:hypothetical protein
LRQIKAAAEPFRAHGVMAEALFIGGHAHGLLARQDRVARRSANGPLGPDALAIVGRLAPQEIGR